MILFVNACIRGKDSTTLELCRHYLAGAEDVQEVDLDALRLDPYTSDLLNYRTPLNEAQAWDDPIYDLAKQIKEADEVVIGAPYWDLSFPSVLKIYIEHCSVGELTFHYTDDGKCEGLCKSKRLVYISSCGGDCFADNHGFTYMQAISNMFGLGECYQVAACGMDVVGADRDAIMADAKRQIDELK